MGTSCDFRIHPDPLTKREQLPCLPNQCALRTWLANKVDIPVSHGPDNVRSPHAYDKEVDYEPLFQGLAMQVATDPPSDSSILHPTKQQLLALRMVAFGISIEHLELVNSLLLGGRMPYNFLHDHWTLAVQDYLDGKPLIEVFTVQAYRDVVHEAAPDRNLPDIVRIDCTGLGGHNLGGPIPWHICVRTDRHGQSIYGPSLATVETTVHHPQRRPRHIAALGLTKAMHEFLTLHYFATDSAAGWEELLLKRLPEATLLKASARRLIALDMFEKSHIAPSHRRLPHPSWTTSFGLLVDLLLGAGKTRYLNTRPHARARREVFVRGFSAGSYSGICLLHLLWKLPFVEAHGKLGGIACPLELLCTIPADKGQGLHLFHYERDLLCCWQPTTDFIQKLPCVCTIVANDWADLNDHFGKSEHEYGHWIDLPMQAALPTRPTRCSSTQASRCHSTQADVVAQLPAQEDSTWPGLVMPGKPGIKWGMQW